MPLRRARLITRGTMLGGLHVNSFQANPTAAVSYEGNCITPYEGPAPKPGKKRRTKHKQRQVTEHPRGKPVASIGVKPFTCPECGKRFKLELALEQHRHDVHKTAALTVNDMMRCEICGVLVKNRRMNKHLLRIHGIH